MAYEHEICAKKILINLKHHEGERDKPIRCALLTKEDIKQCANRLQVATDFVHSWRTISCRLRAIRLGFLWLATLLD